MLKRMAHQVTRLIALAFLGLAQNSFAEGPRPLAVIVSGNAEFSSTKKINAEELSLIYWRKKQYWQGGVRIHPVNLQAEHPLRLYFSKVVLDSTPDEQSNYWNGLYFHGTAPPYSVQSEEAVLRYVASTKGAIGYVDACKVDTRVKPMLWIVDEKISIAAPENLNCNNPP